MENLINIGQIQWGDASDCWRTSLLSPYGKVISEEEWDSEGWSNADLDFEQQSVARQHAIRRDVEDYFEEFGEFFIALYMSEPYPSLENKTYFEPLMEPVFRKENLTCFVDSFLTGKSQRYVDGSPTGTSQVSVFHLGRECFVNFCFDMSVLIRHRVDLPHIDLKVLKLTEI